MTHYVKDTFGRTHKVEEIGWEDGKVFLIVDSVQLITRKMYYRPERTLDDHMGNTPCGYYAEVPLDTGERKRVYLQLAK